MKSRGFTLIELMIVIAVIAVVTAIALPGLIASQRSSNERSGSASLKSVATAQYDFRSNDRDGNQIQDFWTGDVSGLHRLVVGGAKLELIEFSIARADGAPLPSGSANGLMGTDLTPTAKASYWYYSCDTDLNANPDLPYKVDAGDGYGAVHNTGRFAIISYPDYYPTAGKLVFVISESGVIFKRDPAIQVANQGALPRTPNGPYNDYPDDPIGNGWGGMD